MTAFSLFLVLVLIPALTGYALNRRDLLRSVLEPGDPVIYRKNKVSSHPGARARNVWASEKGDEYFYEVDKFWAVGDVLRDGRLVAVTRTGKTHYIDPGDASLRRPGLLERWRYRDRFPRVDFEA